MGWFWDRRCTMPPAQRGQIVQRILVDGWSAAEAARQFGIGEREVARWVAAYRRDGMASLRDDTAVERAPRRWLRRFRLLSTQLMAGIEGRSGEGDTAPCIELPRRADERRRR